MIKAIAPLTGWVLDIVGELDRHAAGFAGQYLRASDERRQVIAAYLAVAPVSLQHGPRAFEVAEFLARANHRAILCSAFGSAPSGLRGALARSGSQPHERRYYERLHKLLSKPPHRDFVRTINQLPVIDHDRLRIAQRLPSEICRANVVNAIESVKEASDVASLVDLFVTHGADAEGLFTAIRKVGSEKALARVWKQWSRRMMFRVHPVPASAAYMPILGAADLRRLALRYHNCAERYVVGCLDGFEAFAEYRGSGNALVVHLGCEKGEWRIEGMFGKHNANPAPEVEAEAVAYLSQHGVKLKPPRESASGEWEVLNRLSRRFRFDLDDED